MPDAKRFLKMRCPYCIGSDTEVVETRVAEDGNNVRRRRICTSCHKRFTTYERIENVTLVIKKKDGKREQFSRDKLKNGLIKACEKTTISVEQIEKIVEDTEKDLRNGDSVEIESIQVGQFVAERLKSIDKVAYIRFSSVFKRFVDVEDFEKELKRLIQ